MQSSASARVTGIARHVERELDPVLPQREPERRIQTREPAIDLELLDRHLDPRSDRLDPRGQTGRELEPLALEHQPLTGQREHRDSRQLEAPPDERPPHRIAERALPADPRGHREIGADQLVDRFGVHLVEA